MIQHIDDRNKKGKCKMAARRWATVTIVIACSLLGHGFTFGADSANPLEEQQNYERDRNRVVSLRTSLLQSSTNDLPAYEEFADEIDEAWRERNREFHARLMLEVCKPLSSGIFKDDRRYELARKYALSALEEADEIPLPLELELTGHVTTVRIGPDASRGEDFVEVRTQDVAVRLHAWKRLIEAIDPNWDPDEVLWLGNVEPPAATGLPAGVAPEAIKDATLRAEYEAAIRNNRQKAEEYKEQYELHKWQKRFLKRAESEIIQAHSFPPFDIGNLRKMLDDHLNDQEAKLRIVEAVNKIRQETQRGEQ